MKLFAIIVLYNCNIEESKTIISLLKIYKKHKNIFKNLNLIIYDNSKEKHNIHLSVNFNYKYVHNPLNPGLAVAYNYALEKAIASSYNWLLLLDQDSILPRKFFENLSNTIINVENNDTVVAIVPKMHKKGSFFSPSKKTFTGNDKPIDMNHKGIYEPKISAINSGSTIKVSFLKEIKGFNELFSLDFLDHWLYFTIYKLSKKVYVMDFQVEHELSISNYDNLLDEKRYNNILKYETIFILQYKSKIDFFFYCLRLILRTFRLYTGCKNKRFSLITLNHLKNIIFHSSSFLN